MNKSYIFWGIVIIICMFGYLRFLNQRDTKLMQLCPDAKTQTLYNC